MALSCVYRSGQRFGVGHLTDILRGEQTERIASFGHDRLTTFGIGRALDERRWKGVFRQLLALGLLETDPDGHGSLRLTEASRPVLRGEAPVRLREEAAPVAGGRRRGKSTAPGETAVAPADDPLFEALRALRARLAREQNVPAYVIFHDSTLRAVATLRPRDRQALAGVPGIGGAKLDRYADGLLSVVREHADAAASTA